MQSFAREEVAIPVKCNVHPWMKAYIGVLGSPYFQVTGKDGSFTHQQRAAGNLHGDGVARALRPQDADGHGWPQGIKAVEHHLQDRRRHAD